MRKKEKADVTYAPSATDHEEIIKQYEKQLQQISTKKSKKDTKKEWTAKESARRIALLESALNLNVQQMASLCNLPPGKFARLKAGGTPNGTPLSQEDATRICIAVLKKHGVLIPVTWLLAKDNQTPPALINSAAVKEQVEKYTEQHMMNRTIIDTMSIFLEIEHLEKVHGAEKTQFVMVSDNKLKSKYQKGDYVGGLLIPKEVYFMINGMDCILSLKKDLDVKFVRKVYYKAHNNDSNGEELNTNDNKELFVLCTDTNAPNIISPEDVDSIYIIFFHRNNNEDFLNFIGIINSDN